MKITIIGAGPSGLICAYKLREKGHDVTLIDKNQKVGRKIFITGKGRCNLTNNCTAEDFFKNIVNNPRFLNTAYGNFTSQDTMKFFEDKGIELVTERGNRVFPKSYNAADIIDALFFGIRNLGVHVRLNETVKHVYKENTQFKVETDYGTYFADKLVIATGGKSYSLTGSTGDGYHFAENFGHTIITPVPGLCALQISENIPFNLYKFTLKNVSLKVVANNKTFQEQGEITFYKEGVAGPIAITISSLINRIDPSKITMEIDLKPALSEQKIDERILREIENKNNKTLADIISKLLPKEFIKWFNEVAGINDELSLKDLKKEERKKLVSNLKHFKLTFKNLENIDHAIITSGGVSTKEINQKTLESKIVEGLYFAGEIIDVDAFTGGFNMQIAFSTGALVAKSINDFSVQ